MQMNPTNERRLAPYVRGTGLSRFLPIPVAALEWGLSAAALLTYGLLLDRVSLSRRSGLTDEEGRYLVIYPVASLGRVLGRSETTVKRVLKELEDHGLIRRDHSAGRASRIALWVPEEALAPQREPAGRRRRAAAPPPEQREPDLGDLNWLLGIAPEDGPD